MNPNTVTGSRFPWRRRPLLFSRCRAPRRASDSRAAADATPHARPWSSPQRRPRRRRSGGPVPERLLRDPELTRELRDRLAAALEQRDRLRRNSFGYGAGMNTDPLCQARRPSHQVSTKAGELQIMLGTPVGGGCLGYARSEPAGAGCRSAGPCPSPGCACCWPTLRPPTRRGDGWLGAVLVIGLAAAGLGEAAADHVADGQDRRVQPRLPGAEAAVVGLVDHAG